MKKNHPAEQPANTPILTIDPDRIRDEAHAREIKRLQASFAARQRSGRPLTYSIVQAYRRAIERTATEGHP